jgi:hypothetical protein
MGYFRHQAWKGTKEFGAPIGAFDGIINQADQQEDAVVDRAALLDWLLRLPALKKDLTPNGEMKFQVLRIWVNNKDLYFWRLNRPMEYWYHVGSEQYVQAKKDKNLAYAAAARGKDTTRARDDERWSDWNSEKGDNDSTTQNKGDNNPRALESGDVRLKQNFHGYGIETWPKKDKEVWQEKNSTQGWGKNNWSSGK